MDASAPKCRFCSAVIDPVAAAAATEKMARINQAAATPAF
jgi:hypothetical protein